MPLGNKHKDLVIWDGIIEKTEKVSNMEDTIFVIRGQTYTDKFCVRYIANLCYVLISYPY